MKEYRVLYNQDDSHLFVMTREPITPHHVDRMVDEVADRGAGVMLINPNSQRVNYPSRAWQTFWDGYAPGRREFFGPVPDADVPGREAWVRQMMRLADQGCDYMARALARCRQRGIAPGVTIRMNDMHDGLTPGTNLFSRFYMEHRDLCLNIGDSDNWGGKGLNYEHVAVRNHYLALIRELAQDYDFDVMELDFLRFQCYFPRSDFDKHAGIMTEFIREVRAILDTSGRPVSLMARVAATPACAYELGFDVARWAREGIIDGVTAGAFLNTQWFIPVDEFRALVGKDVAVYACTDCAADHRPGLPMRSMPLEPQLLRGFAAGHLATGADGVELFNFFCAREESWGLAAKTPSFATLRELGALAPLRGLAKTYTLTSNGWPSIVDGAAQVPVAIASRETRSFQMLLAAEPATVGVEVSVVFAGEADVNATELWLQVNHVPAGPASPAEAMVDSTNGARRAAFTVPAEALRDGRNTLLLRNEGKTVTVISMDLRVRV